MIRRWLPVLMLVWAGCSSDSGEVTDPRAELLNSWWSGFLAPELQSLETSSDELVTATTRHCADKTPQTLEDAQNAWVKTHRHLKRYEVFNFGPYSDEPLRFRPLLDFWPARPDSIETSLMSATAWSAADVAMLGGAARGLPAAEYLLWNDDPALDDSRCSYLVAVTQDIAAQSSALRVAWDPEQDGYYQQLLEPGSSSDYATIVLAVSEVINRLWFTVENIRITKLGKPVGDDAGGVAQPELAEARFMPRSLDAIRDNLDAIEILYFGDQELVGVAKFVGQKRPELNDEIRVHLSESRAALDAIDEALVDAVDTDPQSVRDAIDALGGLQTAIEVDVISVLGLSLSFNDNDGD